MNFQPRIFLETCSALLLGIGAVSTAVSVCAQNAGPMVIQWQKAYGGQYYDYSTFVRPTADGYVLMGTTEGAGGSFSADLWVSRLDHDGNVVWQGAHGGSGYEWAYGLVAYPDGSSISLGVSGSSASGNKTNNSPGTWLVKLDSNGGKLWEAVAGGDRPQIAMTRSGGAYVGTSVRGADFTVVGPGGTISGRYLDASISKQAPDGSYFWTRNYHYAFTNRVMALCETSDEGVMVGGNAPMAESLWRNDYFLMRLNAQGDFLWAKTFGGSSNENLRVVRETSDGGFLLGGESFSSASNTKSTPNYGNSDCWIVKVDSQGQKLWDKTYGGSGEEQLWDIVLLSDGGFIAAANSSSANGNKTSPAFGGFDGWLIRCDANGNKLWEQTIGGDNLDGILSFSQTPDGGFIAGIETLSGVSGNKTTPNLGLSDFWIVKLAAEPPILRWDRCCASNGFSEWSLVLCGTSNVTYRVETSTNLTTWTAIQTNLMSGTQTELLRGGTGSVDRTFYRASILQ